MSADAEHATSGRPRWAALTPPQRALAEDLAARAQRLWEGAEGDLSLAEAVDLAVIQGGHDRRAGGSS